MYILCRVRVYIIIEGWSFLTGAHLLCVIGRNKSLGEYLSARSPPVRSYSSSSTNSSAKTRSRRVPPAPIIMMTCLYYYIHIDYSYILCHVPGPSRWRSFVFKQFRWPPTLMYILYTCMYIRRTSHNIISLVYIYDIGTLPFNCANTTEYRHVRGTDEIFIDYSGLMQIITICIV